MCIVLLSVSVDSKTRMAQTKMPFGTAPENAILVTNRTDEVINDTFVENFHISSIPKRQDNFPPTEIVRLS